MHQYNIRILYMPGPELFMTECLFRQNCETNRDGRIPGLHITINAIFIHGHIIPHDSRRNKTSNVR